MVLTATTAVSISTSQKTLTSATHTSQLIHKSYPISPNLIGQTNRVLVSNGKTEETK